MKINDGHNCTNKICEICTLGRQGREAETKSREKASQALSVVHTDICGPMETPSLKGERYFISFTAETTGRVSISLLRSKDRALVVFQAYHARAEKASGNAIKSLRRDGGGEYMNQGFNKYLESDGSRVGLPRRIVQHRMVLLNE